VSGKERAVYVIVVVVLMVVLVATWKQGGAIPN
jgi:hypothetical protein